MISGGIFFQRGDAEKMKTWYGKDLGLVTGKKVPATFLSIAGDPGKGLSDEAEGVQPRAWCR